MPYNLTSGLTAKPSAYAPTKRMDRKSASLFRQIFPITSKEVWSSKRSFRAIMRLRDGTTLRWATSFELKLTDALRGANRDPIDVVKYRSWAV
jgi:hypothetical protein